MWDSFEIFALISFTSWIVAAIFCISNSNVFKIVRDISMLLGIISLGLFITLLWIKLERPPLRTLGETRLWYSFFMSVIGFAVYKRWNYRLFLLYAIFMAILFLIINYAKPEIHNKALMPALQSNWFVPHVIVYMISYAFIGFSSLVGGIGLWQLYKEKDTSTILNISENIVHIGFGFLSMGLIFGALWAKEAWGHYWTWDPKETWAFITWGTYLIFIHIRINKPNKIKLQLRYLTFAFIILLICWFGINYLPAAQNSVHVYAN